MTEHKDDGDGMRARGRMRMTGVNHVYRSHAVYVKNRVVIREKKEYANQCDNEYEIERK